MLLILIQGLRMDAYIITIGDELLAGDVPNDNATWLAKKLTQKGIKVKKIIVIPDDVALIKKELDEIKDNNGYIFITGGLGSTHDDVTRDAVSLFLKKDLKPVNNEMFEIDIMNTRLQKMIEIPVGTKPIFNKIGGAIGFIIEDRIFVMPGVPEEMRSMFLSIEDKLKGDRFYTRWIMTKRTEADIGEILEDATIKFNVKIGSYPQRYDKGDFVLKIKIESTDKTEVESAINWLGDRFEITCI
ncbi:MAG: competence/damage-inducible protein A [Candidatus Methanoliparum thermophilum]|uniref:Competence/damage-inducible protein A n=1 Tax=Methanoliparum thermophilum TaxID=2491083 RepID=A0A520KRD0_METT2|nr:MAG: competence/damage-inducible protein A [Candidatus Methanoliparum thermophilum]